MTSSARHGWEKSGRRRRPEKPKAFKEKEMKPET
jgi:hypothetical protein